MSAKGLRLLLILALGTGTTGAGADDGRAAFVDATAGSGLGAWSSRYGARLDKRTILENIGGGVALVDLDGDGPLDAYLPTGQPTYDRVEHRNALFRGRGDGRFSRGPEHTGAELAGWYFGVAAADYDDDGYRDLYVTEHGRNALLRNNGDGTFSDVTEAAGAGFDGFGTGAAWADYDRDGWLDLAVTNYVDVDPATVPPPGSGPHCRWKGVAVPCGPRGLGGERAVLLRGDGSGGFERVQEEAFAPADFYGLGVVWSDHDADGWIDLYIADDQTPNRLFLNHEGTLQEAGLLSAAAFSEDGHAEAGMGTDWADVDADGLADIFVTNFADEKNTLYRALAPGLFTDATVSMHLALPSFRQVGWGTGLIDFDLDGDLDLFVANGHVYSQVDTHGLSDSYRQRDQLFLRDEDGYREWEPGPGDALAQPAVSRGAAFGDVDADGDVDVLVGVLDGPPRLLSNELATGGRLEVRLRGRSGNRAAVGARAVLEVPGLPPQAREVRAGHSYISQSAHPLHFAIPAGTTGRLVVHWPSGPPSSSPVIDVEAGQVVVVTEGRGHRLAADGAPQ